MIIEKIYKIQLNLSKVPKSAIWEDRDGNKRLTIDVVVFDEPDKYGSDCAAKVWNPDTKESGFVGNGKILERKEKPQKKSNAPPKADKKDDDDNLPF